MGGREYAELIGWQPAEQLIEVRLNATHLRREVVCHEQVAHRRRSQAVLAPAR